MVVGVAEVTLFLQSLPLLALAGLLATGRVEPPVACAVAIVLALPAVWGMHGSAGELARFIATSLAEGLWLAIVPVGIIAGGLVFHEAVGGPGRSRGGGVQDTLFTAAFLLGPFTETVTGFGVGSVFAIGAIRAVGVSGAPAAAIGLLAMALIPWGGLGPGTALGAALAEVPAQALATRNAWQLAPSLLLMLPLFWHLCAVAGHPVPTRLKLRQGVWVGSLGGLLVLCHQAIAWEMCGMAATGLALSAKLLLAHPPRRLDDWGRALRAAFPYLLLAGALLSIRAVGDAPALAPMAGLPALPLNHPIVALWLVAFGLLIACGRRPWAALRRGRKPALALLMFVLLSRVLSNAGVPQALAGALAARFGSYALYASPVLAAAAGFFAGTNVGSNSAMMPLQASLGRMAGLDPTVLPAVQNGTLALILSGQLTAVASPLAGPGATPASIWRLAWPLFLIGIAVGLAAIAIG